MSISVFDLFSIGMGPSSSHTVGPMRAARQFVLELHKAGLFSQTDRVHADLYGSLALTGKGHATDIAVMLGFAGETPQGIDPNTVASRIKTIQEKKKLSLLGSHSVGFQEKTDLIFHFDKQLPFHPNGMRFTAYDRAKKEIFSKVFYSVGGGFIVSHDETQQSRAQTSDAVTIPFPFKTGDGLLEIGRKHQMSIPEIMLANEKNWKTEEEILKGLLTIWNVMQGCINRGCEQEGILPGGLKVKRRAAEMFRRLSQRKLQNQSHPVEAMEWVSLWALAVNEENAAGGRVVTAPTNGAAGVIPAVLSYYHGFTEGANTKGIIDFMLTAGAMGILYKEGASISAAEMGCMGEVGVACSMAAAGLTAAWGGTNEQIENAAEIGMEHNLGLTCDPVMGLVQIPCIERNTMGAVKAINAALLAMQGDGSHRVSLDQVIATMRQTGNDMKAIYKETSQGGLAVNVPEC